MRTSAVSESPADVELDAQVQRVEHSLQDLNTRIARLAMALHARLDSAPVLQSVLDRSHDAFAAVVRDAAQPGAADATLRTLHEWEELRGLLAMRCDLMTHTLHELGLALTRTIADLAEAELGREGFEPGATGFELHRRLSSRP